MRSGRRGGSCGMLSLEALFGISLLLLVGLVLLGLGREVVLQLRLEEEATAVARAAARQPVAPGTRWNGSLGDADGRVSVWWSEELVTVRLEAGSGRRVSKRTVVREIPWTSRRASGTATGGALESTVAATK